MRDFMDVDEEDYLSGQNSPEFGGVYDDQKTLSDLPISANMQRSAFYFESFEDFINDPKIIMALFWTIVVAVTVPLFGSICYRIYKKMTLTEELFKSESKESLAEEKHVAFAEQVEESDENDKPKSILNLGSENFCPFSLMDMTDEDKILMAAAIDADDSEFDMSQALHKVKLHGKLATAQLHHKTQKIEHEMTDEEREQERVTRNDQLAKIFAMMESNSEKFGIQSEDELREQMKLYNV